VDAVLDHLPEGMLPCLFVGRVRTGFQPGDLDGQTTCGGK
jgi:hypothetical protein